MEQQTLNNNKIIQIFRLLGQKIHALNLEIKELTENLDNFYFELNKSIRCEYYYDNDFRCLEDGSEQVVSMWCCAEHAKIRKRYLGIK